jgi:anti-sigma regulatory factor (Ser/Thr protein kinase)
MKERQENILNFVAKGGSVTSPEVARFLGVSRQQAHALLRTLVRSGRLTRLGKTRAVRYLPSGGLLPIRDEIARMLENKNLKEHEVLADVRERFLPLRIASENVRSIFDYAFSEMLNNAIDHSQSKRIEVWVAISGSTAQGDPELFSFVVRDYGIGVFRNLQQKRGLSSELESMQDLLKGKVTTDPEAHSGQGIFFSSKAADRFSLRSYGWEMRIDNMLPDIFFLKDESVIEGTEVRFDIAYRSPRHLIDVFRAFESEDGSQDFDRTEIHVRLFVHGTVHVSRSQARRILVGLETFKRITLDFDRVSAIGQAFADEIFRVFRTRHPDIRIDVVHANEAVQFMIHRVDYVPPKQSSLI